MTGPLLRMGITGRDGLTLEKKWADGPATYLGLQVAGFPNLFTTTGPGSPSVLTNMPTSIEQHVEWIARCIEDLRRTGRRVIEPTPEAEVAWTGHVAEASRSEEHTSELQSLMRISYAVFCLKKKKIAH